MHDMAAEFTFCAVFLPAQVELEATKEDEVTPALKACLELPRRLGTLQCLGRLLQRAQKVTAENDSLIGVIRTCFVWHFM